MLTIIGSGRTYTLSAQEEIFSNLTRLCLTRVGIRVTLQSVRHKQIHKMEDEKTAMKNMKRIHKVVIKRMVDESPDTSWLGEYADSPTSEYSIDREHALDCPQQTYNAKSSDRCMMVITYTDKLERAIAYLNHYKTRTFVLSTDEQLEAIDEAQDILISAQDDIQDEANACDCGGHGDKEHGQYRYFNPSFNYVDTTGKRLPENTDDGGSH